MGSKALSYALEQMKDIEKTFAYLKGSFQLCNKSAPIYIFYQVTYLQIFT